MEGTHWSRHRFDMAALHSKLGREYINDLPIFRRTNILVLT